MIEIKTTPNDGAAATEPTAEKTAAGTAREPALSESASDAGRRSSLIREPLQPLPEGLPFNGASAACELYEAMKGGATGIGADDSRIIGALQGHSAEELAAISDSYREHYGRDLAADLRSELRAVPRIRECSEALLRGDPTEAAAIELKMRIDLPLREHDRIVESLGELAPSERQAVAEQYRLLYGTELYEALADRLDGENLAEVKALLAGDDARAAASVLKRELAVGPANSRVIDELLSASPHSERPAMQAAFQELTGHDLCSVLETQFSGVALEGLLARVRGNDMQADALNLRLAIDRRHELLETIEQHFAGRSQDARQALLVEYRQRFGTDLALDLKRAAGDQRAELNATLDFVKKGMLDDLQRIDLAFARGREGLPLLHQTLQDMSGTGVQNMIRNYRDRTNEDFVQKIREGYAGGDRFDLELKLLGKAETLAHETDLANARYDYERRLAAWTSARAMDLLSNHGKLLDRNIARLNQQYEKIARQDVDLNNDDEIRLYNLLDFVDQDVLTYRSARRALSGMIANLSALLSALVGFLVARHSAQPFVASVVAALVIAAVTKNVVAAYMLSRTHDGGRLLNDLKSKRASRVRGVRSRRRQRQAAMRRAALDPQRRYARYRHGRRKQVLR